MSLTWESIQGNAIAFVTRWKDASNEEAQAQSFTTDFLKVFGIDDPEKTGDFEYKVSLDEGRTGYIDYLWKKKLAIEMKSRGKDLNKAYTQLKEYVFHLPDEDMPDMLMVCDFATIVLHSRTTGEKFSFKTKDLRKHIKRFADIAGYETTRIYENQIDVNVKAAEKMARLHDALKEYGYEGHCLEVYLVRILFCLFADDTGIFPDSSFANYIENSREDGSDLSSRLAQLFEILNCSDVIRAKRKLLTPTLLQFRYINGGLFAQSLPFADFNAKMRQTLLDCCAFDWNKISPAIFGAMFQGVMDKKQRRELGAHYTSEENILKLINPLFMDALWREFDRVKAVPARLDAFHHKIASLKFLDPACGCGNFLIITYRELRLLELEILKMKTNTGQRHLDISTMLKVSVEQFYGIEYEDFPCQIAQVGMWLMDHQMNLRVADMFGMYYARLPLTQSATIVHANALRMDWEDVVPAKELSYILGNPPFVGARIMSAEQKDDLLHVFEDTKNAGNLDYVCCWYKKLCGCIHPHRAPGFENRKPKHRREDGSFPEVKLLVAEKRECRKALELARQIAGEYEAAAESRKRWPVLHQGCGPSGDAVTAYHAHLEDIRCHLTIEDYSRVDAMIALRLRATGHGREAVMAAVRQCAPFIRETAARRDWQRYAERTADYAFGMAGDVELAKYETYRELWRRVEESAGMQQTSAIHTRMR